MKSNKSNFFYVKLHFWQFYNFSQFKNWFLAIFEIAKNGIIFREIDLFDFTIFFGLDLFKFSGPLCWGKILLYAFHFLAFQKTLLKSVWSITSTLTLQDSEDSTDNLWWKDAKSFWLKLDLVPAKSDGQSSLWKNGFAPRWQQGKTETRSLSSSLTSKLLLPLLFWIMDPTNYLGALSKR